MDHFTGTSANDMDAKNAIGFGICQHFHEAIGGPVGTCATVGCEIEFADAIVDACGFEVFFGLSNRGDLRTARAPTPYDANSCPALPSAGHVLVCAPPGDFVQTCRCFYTQRAA